MVAKHLQAEHFLAECFHLIVDKNEVRHSGSFHRNIVGYLDIILYDVHTTTATTTTTTTTTHLTPPLFSFLSVTSYLTLF